MNNEKVKAYKVFNEDWTCRGYQYEVGATYHHEGAVELCASGFHACVKISDCFEGHGYNFVPDNRYAEVEVWGEIVHGDDKLVANNIKIIRELRWADVLKLCNSGNWNSGNWNSGNWNSGDCNSGNCNSGNRNSGNRNSGNRNSGNRNSGNCNSGNCNSGNRNSGNWNSGNWNSGNWNSGDWNSGDRNSGFFCNTNGKCIIFNKECDLDRNDLTFPEEFYNLPITQWIFCHEMTDEEKENNPDCMITGGFLRKLSYKESWAVALKDMDDELRGKIKALPNFDVDVFEDITGVKID